MITNMYAFEGKFMKYLIESVFSDVVIVKKIAYLNHMEVNSFTLLLDCKNGINNDLSQEVCYLAFHLFNRFLMSPLHTNY